MKPKNMILMVVAVTCGLGASYMTSRLLAERGNSGPEEQEKVVILVAKKNLDTGLTIKDPGECFVEKAVPRGEEPKNAISKYEDLKGRVLKHGLREGDFVSPGDVLNDRETYIAYMLPKGYRALGLRVNLEAIAAGFSSLPLSRVDIVSTVRKHDEKGSYAQVLLQNVLVLAADQQTKRTDESPAMPATVVTVALKPEEVLKATLAKEYGPLTLVLRKFNDASNIDSDKLKLTMDGINGNHHRPITEEPVVAVKQPEPKKAPEVKVAPPAPKTRTHVVTVVSGADQKQVEYTLNDKDEVIGVRVLPHEGLRPESPPPAVGAPNLANPPAPSPAPGEPK